MSSGRVIVLYGVMVLACGGCLRPSALPHDVAAQVDELTQTLARVPSEDINEDLDKIDAAHRLGLIGLEYPLPDTAVKALEAVAKDERRQSGTGEINVLLPTIGILGLTWDMAIADGANEAFLMWRLRDLPSEADRLALLWQTWAYPRTSPAVRRFCLERLWRCESRAAIPYLLAVTTDPSGDVWSQATFRLTEFYPLSRDALVLLSGCELGDIAEIAAAGLQNLGRRHQCWFASATYLIFRLNRAIEMDAPSPGASFLNANRALWDSDLVSVRAPRAPAGGSAMPKVSRVRLGVRQEVEAGAGTSPVDMDRALRQAISLCGVTVLGPDDTASDADASVEVNMQWQRWRPSNRKPDSPLAGARLEGCLTAQVKGESRSWEFSGEAHRELLYDRPLLAPPLGEAFVQSDFAAAFAEMMATLLDKDESWPLYALIMSDDFRVGSSAAWALAEIADPQCLETLTRGVLEGGAPLARVASCLAIGRVLQKANLSVPDRAEALEILTRALLRDDDWQVWEAAARVLGRLTAPQGAEPLMEALRNYRSSDNWIVRRSIAWALGRIGDPRAIPVLLRLSREDPDTRVRTEAGVWLSLLQKPAASGTTPKDDR